MDRQMIGIEIDATIRPCRCGGMPRLYPYNYKEGYWVVQCPKCFARTIAQDTPEKAVKAWRLGVFTKSTKLCLKKLTLKTVDINGVINLVGAIGTRAVEDLMWCEKHDRLDSKEADEARKWIRNKQLIADIESGEIRKREEMHEMIRKIKREAKEKEAM